MVYCGPNVMLGYAETSADLGLGRTVDVLHTGDIARRRDDGLYEVLGRRARFLKIFGLRVDLDQAEAAFGRHGIAVACAGDDEELIVAHDGVHDLQVIRGLAMSEFGLPASAIRVCRLPQLPRLPTGKPDYRAVLELAGDDLSATPAATSAHAGRPEVDAETLRKLFAEILDRPDATLEATFVSLGGDSLSYVEMSLQLEAALGQLPTAWHATPIRDLAPVAARPRRLGHAVETSIALRAVAILLIIGTHAQLFNLLGSAHVLIAIAGYNFARFQLTSAGRTERLRRQLVAVLRIAVPSIAWIAIAFLLTEKYSLANVFLLNAVLGAETWDQRWHFWFVEVLIYVLIGLAVLLAIPWLDRAERRSPFGFVAVVLGFALLSRFEIVDLGWVNTKPVLWLFALGWATARAENRWQKLGLAVATVGTVPGFFGDPTRELIVILGLALLVWVPRLRCPSTVSRVAGVLASSSLYIYLTHWQIYPYLSDAHPMLAVVASLIVGLLYWGIVSMAMRALTRTSVRLVTLRCPVCRRPRRRAFIGWPRRRVCGGRSTDLQSGSAAVAARTCETGSPT